MKPNILMLHCHDLGDYIGCYSGNCANTPNLDRLAGEGVVFENHFAASPTCSPSRGTMLTGLMPHRNGLMALASGGHWEMPTDVPVLPKILSNLGYQTVNLGVWHISEDPCKYGIDITDPQSYCEPLSANALNYLENRPKDKPFFLRVGFHSPHLPFTDKWPDSPCSDEVQVPPFLKDDPVVREELSKFYGDISNMDKHVGQILDYLKNEGLDKNTLVIFTADHGPGFPLAKCTLYDAGIKIPLILRWKGKIEGDRRFDGLSSNADFMPTLLEAIGEKESVPDGLDGHSLWPFAAEGKEVRRDGVFAEQTWHDFYEPIRAIRTKDYKLIRNFQPGKGLQVGGDVRQSPICKVMSESLCNYVRPEYELYDLQKDPEEKNNLSGHSDCSDIENQLKNKLNGWLSSTNDPILKGVVPAPRGYWQHHWCKPTSGPGGLPVSEENKDWYTLRWPGGAIRQK